MTDHPRPIDPLVEPAASGQQKDDPGTLLGPNRAVLDAISEAIYIQDAEGRFLDVNDGVVRMYGYPRSFFIGQTPNALSEIGRAHV